MRKTGRRVELPRWLISGRLRHELVQMRPAVLRVDPRRQPSAFVLLHLAPHLHDHAGTLVEARSGSATHRQKTRPPGADIHENCIEPRGSAHYSTKMDAAGRRRVAALDIELRRGIAFDPSGAPLAGSGGDQQETGQMGYPRPASSCAVSYSGRPTTFE